MKKFPKTLAAPTGTESTLETAMLLVAFKNPKTPDEAAATLQPLGLALATSDSTDPNNRWNAINHTPTRYWARTADGSQIDDARLAAIEKYLGDQLLWVGPVYSNPGAQGRAGHYCPLPDTVLVPKSSSKSSKVAGVVNQHNLSVDENRSRHLSGFDILRVPNDGKTTVFELKNKVHRAGGQVLFENMPMFKPTCADPNDPWFPSQWDMAQIGAARGWDIQKGIGDIIVAILDEGVDFDHPDLQNRAGDGLNLQWGGPGTPTGPHGTACAGIAAAALDNGLGVAGVAGGCRILPLAFAYWTDVECAIGINFATANGASVVSMSFGVYDGWGWDYNIIDPEIQNAHNNNVTLVAAAGNENDGSTNRYPGRHPLVICVGGSSTDDNRKNPSSPDGEYWWGASYGEDWYNGTRTGLSVVAPCVLCPTTDQMWGNGYSGDEYFAQFNGTSAATPHVAGLAALLKSQNPARTNIEIRDIIEKSAAKVGSLPYADNPDFPNGPRNQEMGYGRIDVAAALSYSAGKSCGDLRTEAKKGIMDIALGKQYHLASHADCPDFSTFTNPNGGKALKAEPCFYLHWGDSPSDSIETEDFEVAVLSACNPFNNAMFRGVVLSEIEVVHSDGSPVATLPDGTPSVMVVPSKMVCFPAIEPSSCASTELVVKSSGALAGGYKLRFNCCVDAIDVWATASARPSFDLELVAS